MPEAETRVKFMANTSGEIKLHPSPGDFGGSIQVEFCQKCGAVVFDFKGHEEWHSKSK